MKFPTSLIIKNNISSNNFFSEYWIYKIIFIKNNSKNIELQLLKKIYNFKFKFNNFIFFNLIKNTTQYSKLNQLNLIKQSKLKKKKNLSLDSLKIKNKFKIKSPLKKFKKENLIFFNFKNISNILLPKIIIKNYNYLLLKKINLNLSNKDSFFWYFFNINFIKKERIYTKLKYSRVPQYDIVSGGVAAIFAGFLGFLVCEKFGFELLDSADFYILLMYIIFISLILRLCIKIVQIEINFISFFNFKFFFSFFYNFFYILLKFINNKKKKKWSRGWRR